MKRSTRTIEIRSRLTEAQLRSLRLSIARAALRLDPSSLVYLVDAPAKRSLTN